MLNSTASYVDLIDTFCVELQNSARLHLSNVGQLVGRRIKANLVQCDRGTGRTGELDHLVCRYELCWLSRRKKWVYDG